MTDPLKAVRQLTMREWVDAYTVHMETVAAGFSNSRLTAEVKDAEKQVASDLKLAEEGARGLFRSDEARKAADEAEQTAFKNLENQQHIHRQMRGFDFDAYKVIRGIWRIVGPILVSTGWDMAQDIDGHRRKDGIRFTQGKDKLDLPYDQAQVLLSFMQWVGNNSMTDPVAYTKRVLGSQGITAENFDEKCGGLGISNPWAPTASTAPKIIAP
jgi:hypothetical protein